MLPPEAEPVVLQDFYSDGGGKGPRYYQASAVNATIRGGQKAAGGPDWTRRPRGTVSGDIRCHEASHAPRLKPSSRLALVDAISKEPGDDQKNDASNLELPGPLHGDPPPHSNTVFWQAKAKQALDEEAPAQDRQYNWYPRPHVVKRDDAAGQRQVKEPVHEGADFPVTSEKGEVRHPCPGLHDV